MCSTGECGKPIAVLCARVSGKEQRELSPDSQESELKPWLESQGYCVPDQYILKFDWPSQDLLRCTEFNQIIQWARNREIQALGIVHSQRLAGRFSSTGILYDECVDNGVKILSKHDPLPEGRIAGLIFLLKSFDKSETVRENNTRAKDGKHNRAKLRGVPASMVAPYGYRFRYRDPERGSKRIPEALEPDPDTHWVVCKILQMAMQRETLRAICQELFKSEVPTPRGGKKWEVGVVSTIIKNPVYGGRYYALRYESVQPKTRKGDTYGNSGRKLKPRDEWVYVDFPIENPPLTWDQWETLQEWQSENRRFSPRSSTVEFLLGGLLYCGLCGRKIQGHSHSNKIPHYHCSRFRVDHGDPSLKCPLPHMSGRNLEPRVWNHVVSMMQDPDAFISAMRERNGDNSTLRDNIQANIARLDNRLQLLNRRENNLLNLKLDEDPALSDELYQGKMAELRTEREQHQEELARQRTALESLDQMDRVAEHLTMLREEMAWKLMDATFQQKRYILQALHTRITVYPDQLDINFSGTAARRRQVQEHLAGQGWNHPTAMAMFQQSLSPAELTAYLEQHPISPDEQLPFGDDAPEGERTLSVAGEYAPSWRCRHTSNNSWALAFTIALTTSRLRQTPHT